MLSMYFYYFTISPVANLNLNPFHPRIIQGCLVPSLVEIGHVAVEER